VSLIIQVTVRPHCLFLITFWTYALLIILFCYASENYLSLYPVKYFYSLNFANDTLHCRCWFSALWRRYPLLIPWLWLANHLSSPNLLLTVHFLNLLTLTLKMGRIFFRTYQSTRRTIQKTNIKIFTAVRTSNPILFIRSNSLCCYLCMGNEVMVCCSEHT
jgi:hypothetical protein